MVGEQIPETWIGEEVTVSFGLDDARRFGTLRSFTERGIVVEVQVQGRDPVETYSVETYFPIGSVNALAKGLPPNAGPPEVFSF